MYAHQNLTAKEFFSDWTDGLNHTSSVPAVSWWKVGKVILTLDLYANEAFNLNPDKYNFQDVLGMSERLISA